MDTIRREYSLKRWSQVWNLVLAVIFIAVGAHGIHLAITKARWHSFQGWCEFLVPAAITALGLYFVALALRSRVVLQGSRISVRYAILQKSADLNEIRGYGTYARKRIEFMHQAKNISFWHLQLKGRADYISIVQLFDVDDYFYSWLHQLPDLDGGSLNL